MTIRTSPTRLRSTDSEPLVTYSAYKLRRETVKALEREARRLGWSTAALVREVLDGWAKRHGGK